MLPWDHLDSGLDKDWLWQDWQDSLHGVRAGRLPVDPVLRLRRLPVDGHRDPDRPDRPQAAAADRSKSDAEPAISQEAAAGAEPGPGGAAHPHPVRQARAAAVHLAPRLRPGLRAGACAGPACRSRTRRASPRTPRSRTPARRRPAWPARPSTWRSGCRPRSTRTGSRAALDAALSPGLDVLEAVAAGRQRPAWPTASTPRTGGSSCAEVDPARLGGGRGRVPGGRRGAGRADDQAGPPRASTRGPRWSR